MIHARPSPGEPLKVTPHGKSTRQVTLVAGLVRHGKSTTATLFAHKTGQRWGDTSTLIFMKVAEEEGVSVEELRKWDKGVLRPKLIAMGDKLCESNPCFLSQYLIDSGVSIVAGVRKPDEITRLRLDNPDICFTLVWVEALPVSAREQLRALENSPDDPHYDPQYYFAPDIPDNTNPAIRQMADEIVYNLDLQHLDASIQYLVAKSLLPCKTTPPQPLQ